MKKLLLVSLIVLMLIGCSEQKSVETTTLNDWETVAESHIRNYFSKLNPESLKYCSISEDNVWKKEDGFNNYEMNTYPITDVYSDTSFKWTHDGEYIHVKMYCDYTVYLRMNAFSFTNKKFQVEVSSFRMKKYYNQETKELTALNFE